MTSSSTMRAAVVDRYGPPAIARVSELPRPTPGKGKVLVRVESAAVTAGDARIRGGNFPRGFGVLARLALGLRGPRRKVLGLILAGTVVEVGPGVTEWTVGDRVTGSAGGSMGTHAEYAVAPAKKLVRLPDEVSADAAAAALFGGMTALDMLLGKIGLRAGQSVLVIGGSGAVGTSSIQIAALEGAYVTAVTSSRNAELVRRLGAEQVIDYTSTPLQQIEEQYDVVVDAVGNLTRDLEKKLLKPGGTIYLVVASLGRTVTARGSVKAGPTGEEPEHMTRLMELLAAGRLDPVIQESLVLDEIARAYEIADSGRKVGNVVVRP